MITDGIVDIIILSSAFLSVVLAIYYAHQTMSISLRLGSGDSGDFVSDTEESKGNLINSSEGASTPTEIEKQVIFISSAIRDGK
jgi:hypothetical protein